MKELYVSPELKVELFETEDIITASVDLGDGENGAGWPWSVGRVEDTAE